MFPYRAPRVTAWFDEYQNAVNHMLWPLQIPEHNQTPEGYSVGGFQHHSPPPSCTNTGIYFGRMVLIPPVEVRDL